MKKAFLGIDYGRARIGVAISEAGLIARPFGVIINRGERKNLVAITEIVNENNVGIIVIGLPVHKNMSMSNEVRAFAKTLEPLGLEIAFQNEMLTSVEAEQYVKKNARNLIDSIAASMILQEYLKKGEK